MIHTPAAGDPDLVAQTQMCEQLPQDPFSAGHLSIPDMPIYDPWDELWPVWGEFDFNPI